MDYSLILANVAKHINLTKDEEKYFTSLLLFKKIKAKKNLLDIGEICDFTVFILSGCLRGFTVDSEGNEHVLMFAPKDWWMGDLYAYITNKPAILTIEALEETEYLLITKTDMEKLYTKIPKFERFSRLIIEKSIVALQQRMNDSMSLSAEERYNKFCTTYPSIINSVAQKHIASFIGITPEFLSKLRARSVKKN
jgi:CRP-like cAMP-binding protein